MIEQTPIGYVEPVRPYAEDDFGGSGESCIVPVDGFGADALKRLGEFSHVKSCTSSHAKDET